MKVCYLLRHYPNLSVGEIAELVGLSVSTASRRLTKLKVAATPAGQVIQLVAGARESTVYAATTQGVLYSQDQAKSWTSLPINKQNNVVISVGPNPKNDQELFAYSQQSGLSKSIDGGRNWSTINMPFADDAVSFIAYDKNTPTTIYTLNRSLSIYKTIDSGTNWSKVRA